MSTFFEMARNYNFDTKRSQPQSNVRNLCQTFTTPNQVFTTDINHRFLDKLIVEKAPTNFQLLLFSLGNYKLYD